MTFYSLKDLLPKAANKLHLQGELQAAWVINRASALLKEVFPEEVEREIRVKKFSKGILWMSVSSSAIASEMQHRSHILKTRLNENLGKDLVKTVRSFQEAKSAV